MNIKNKLLCLSIAPMLMFGVLDVIPESTQINCYDITDGKTAVKTVFER